MLRFRRLALLALIAGLIGYAAPRRAQACSVAPDSIAVRDTPANGVVVVDVGCSFGNCFEGELPSELPVMDKTTGEIVAGAIVHTAGTIEGLARIAWKPDAALVAGHTYEVLWQPEAMQGFAELDYEFLALEAATWTADDIVVTASTWLSEGVSESVQCTARYDIECGPNDPSTITTTIALDAAERVGLQVGIDSEASPASADGQYVVTLAMWGEGDEEPEPMEVPGFVYISINESTSFAVAHDAYCYRIEVTSLVDDTVAVTEDCFEHTFGELTSKPLSDDEIAAQLASCEEAPDGFLELWCAGRRAACDEATQAQWAIDGCGTLADTCREIVDHPEPNEPNDPSDPGDPNDPSDPSDPGEAPEGPSETDDESAMSQQPQLEGGCSAVPGDRGGAASPALLLATLLLAGARRRTR